MTHGKLRTENNYLNCNTQVRDKFYSVCSQENFEPNKTFSHFLSHVGHDLFRYNNKTFAIKTLLFKPLTLEHIQGKLFLLTFLIRI